MDDLSDLVRALTPGPDGVDKRARSRLRDAFGAERRRVRREWFLVRAVSVGMVMFIVWSIAPATPTDEELPLIGLAQATAQLVPPEVNPGEQWYVRETRNERMSIVDHTGPVPEDITIVVNTVEETWVDLTAATMQRTSVSHMEVLSPEDREAFERMQRQEQLAAPGRIEEEPVEIAYPGVHPMWSAGPEAVYEELSAAAGASGDVRLDRLAVLKTAAGLMQHHGVDPTKRSTLLLTIAKIPGIEVESADGVVAVRYQYVQGDVAHELRFDFDMASGTLVGESVATLATPTSPSIVLSESRYEARLEINSPSPS